MCFQAVKTAKVGNLQAITKIYVLKYIISHLFSKVYQLLLEPWKHLLAPRTEVTCMGGNLLL